VTAERDTINIAAHLAAMAAAHPTHPSIVVSRGRNATASSRYRVTTFADLDELTDAIAHGLKSVGVDRGVRAVLMAPPSRDFFALTFALFKIGAVPVFVDPGMGVKNLGECLSEAEPAAFIGIPKAHLARVLLGWAKKTLTLRLRMDGWFPGVRSVDSLARPVSGPFPCTPTRPNETAAILFTSGSTGVPKGAVYTHGIFDAQVRLLKRMYDIRPGEVDLATFPLFALFAPALGMTSVVPRMDFTRPASVDPEEILGCVRERSCTTMFGSPAVLNRVGRYAEGKSVSLPTLNRVITAGAPVSALILDRFSKLLRPEVEIVTPYGATESLPVASIGSHEILNKTREDTDSGAGVCVGRPAPEMEIRIIKVTDDPIPRWSESLRADKGTVGEIVVRGPVVTREYFNRPDLTSLAKIEDADGAVLHRMGDVGWLDRDGRLWFCGRKTHRARTEAGVLFTDQVEPVFNRHPKVFRTALVAVSKNGSTVPVLCVELEREHQNANQQTVVEELKRLGAEFPHTANIQTFLFHPGFPVDIRHNAKIFREKLAVWAAPRLP
jgi:acyl-CoA synthetase (AMP-forming)/AMP-acid ligase II